jgi:hypothetical protein
MAWAMAEKNVHELFVQQPTDMLKRKEPLTIAELKRRTTLFVDLTAALSWFYSRTSNQIKPNPLLETIPVPELVTNLRKQALKTRKGQSATSRTTSAD